MSKQPAIIRTDLVRVLTEASLFACKSDLPVLNSVRLEATGTHLLAIASDRFVMGVSSARYEGRPFAITLPMAGVKLVLGACKLQVGWKPEVDLRVTPKGTLLHVTIAETVVTVPTFQEFPYPDWRKLLSESNEATEAVGAVGLNPQYLAKFGKIGTKGSFYLQSPSRPVKVRVGETFVGLIMPLHLRDENAAAAWELPEWLLAPEDSVTEVAS